MQTATCCGVATRTSLRAPPLLHCDTQRSTERGDGYSDVPNIANGCAASRKVLLASCRLVRLVQLQEWRGERRRRGDRPRCDTPMACRARLEVGSSRGASSGSHAAVSRGALRDTAASLCGQTHVRADPRCAARCMQREARDADLVPRGRAASARRLPQRRRCRASHCAHLIVPRLTAAALDRCSLRAFASRGRVALARRAALLKARSASVRRRRCAPSRPSCPRALERAARPSSAAAAASAAAVQTAPRRRERGSGGGSAPCLASRTQPRALERAAQAAGCRAAGSSSSGSGGAGGAEGVARGGSG